MTRRLKEAKPHHLIEQVEVTGGLLANLKVRFVDGLNCAFGERGTFKTTLLELIRFALSQDSKSSRGLIQANLGNGRVRLTVRTKHGVRYVIERAWGEGPQVFTEAGEPIAVSLERDAIFKADIYGPDELSKIAETPELQLTLLDKFVEEDVRRIEASLEKTLRALEHNGAAILRLEDELAGLREVASEAPALEEKLRALQASPGPRGDLLNAAHAAKALREKEARTVATLRTELARGRAEVEALSGAMERRIGSRVDRDVADGPNGEILADVAERVAAARRTLEAALSRAEQACESADADLADSERQLASRHAKQEREYRALLEKSAEESARTAERTQIQRDHLEAVAARADFEARSAERRKLREEREALLDELASSRARRFELRKQVAATLSEELAGVVRVSVLQAGNRDGFRDLLADLLKGALTRPGVVADKIARLGPEELVGFVERDDVGLVAERASLDEERAQKAVQALRASRRLHELEVVPMEDSPRIELIVHGTPKDSATLSSGQRCTAALAILLRESERPLLIDEPESHLDNKYIYEMITGSVCAAKGKRQLIFITHNPNIPVIGRAEHAFEMSFDGTQARVENAGTLEDLKDDLELILEGGAKAFVTRKDCYGH